MCVCLCVFVYLWPTPTHAQANDSGLHDQKHSIGGVALRSIWSHRYCFVQSRQVRPHTDVVCCQRVLRQNASISIVEGCKRQGARFCAREHPWNERKTSDLPYQLVCWSAHFFWHLHEHGTLRDARVLWIATSVENKEHAGMNHMWMRRWQFSQHQNDLRSSGGACSNCWVLRYYERRALETSQECLASVFAHWLGLSCRN